MNMDTLLKDIQYGIRSLLKRPGFTAVAILTLALGIGANSAMFSTVNAVLLRPLQFPESERIVVVEGVNPGKGITVSNMSVADFADWQAQSQAFEQMAGFVSGGSVLSSNEETERVRASGVSAEFFPLLRTNAALGRALQPDDSEKDRSPVMVLSHGLWQRRFGSDPNVVGVQVTLSGRSTTVVGVMPVGFDYPAQSELWVPFPIDPAERRDNRYVNVITRLKPGATLPQAQAELDTINQRLAQSYRDTNAGWGVRLTTLQERLVGETRSSLLLLLGAVAFVLLIACANVANLLLARATARQKEIAVRTALGASRWRIIRQLLTESLVLSIVGGGIGLLLSLWLTKLLVAVSPPNTPRFDEIRPDGRVFLFTLALALLTGVIFGLAPALQASRLNLNERLKEGGRTGAPGAGHNRIRSMMMVSEVALSFMLLVGAGLLIKSFMRLRDVSPGFNTANVLSVRMSIPSAKYSEGEARAQLMRQTLEKVKSIPGVQSAGAVLSLPLGGDTFNVGRSYIREGRPFTPEESGNAAYRAATPDYFRALQIPVLAGRAFTDQDTDQTPKVMLVNEEMARHLWPGESPVGKRLTIWRDEKFAREIVGVVGDTKATLDAPAGQQMYVPYAQDTGWTGMSLVIRTNGEPTGFAGAVRNEIRSIDKGIPVFNVKTMDEVLAVSVGPRRTPMLLLSAFAGVALILAMIGIYGVTAYHVTQRTQEIGIRMALGAQMRDVVKLVLKGGMTLAAAGIVLGLVGAFAVTRLMRSLLFGVQPTDVLTFVLVAVCLLLTALIASYLPARRATKVDPLVALRYE